MAKRSKAQWLQLFEQHTQSGLSANRFCKEKGLCAKYFSLRKKQLVGVEQTPIQRRKRKPKNTPNPKKASSNFDNKPLSNPAASVKAQSVPGAIETIPAVVLQYGRSQLMQLDVFDIYLYRKPVDF